MAIAQITELIDPPSKSNPSNFATKADAFLGALPVLTEQINAVITEINSLATLSASSGGNGLTAASTTSLAMVSSGSVTLTIASGKSFVPGIQVVIWNETNQKGMTGSVTSYSVTTLVVAVSGMVGEAATLADWSIFTIPSVYDFTDTPTGTEVFFPPSIQAILDRTANETRTGLVELATAAETLDGTSSALAIHPAGLASLVPDLPTVTPAMVLPFADAKALPAIVGYSRASTGTDINQNGLITSKAVDVPRFPFDVTAGTCDGLLIEAAATNLCPYSNMLEVTKRLALTSVTGTFQVGETVRGGGAAGVVVHVTAGTTTYLGLKTVTGTFSGTVTGDTSTASGTYSAIVDMHLPTNTTVTPNATTGPDGATNAEKICETTGTLAYSWATPLVIVTANTLQVFSVKLKAAERNVVRLGLVHNGWTNGVNAFFDLTTGTCSAAGTDAATWDVATVAGSGTLPTAKMRYAGDGYWLCSVSCIVDATSTQLRGTLSMYNGTTVTTYGVATYAGTVGYGVYASQAQIESGSIPTSYIDTTYATVTRAADVATVLLSGIDFNTSEGTVVVRARTPMNAPVSNELLVHLDDGTTSNRIYINRGTNKAVTASVVTGGSTVVSLGTTVIPNNTEFFCAFSWKANDFKFTINGATVLTDTAGGVPTGLTTLRLGSPTTAANMWQGTIASVVYYPRALTSSQLQALTL